MIPLEPGETITVTKAPAGRFVRTMQTIALAPPCRPGQVIQITLHEGPRGSYFQVHEPDRGSLGCYPTLPDAVEAAERRARVIEREERHREVARRHDAETRRVRAMGQDEIVAEGRAHPRYGGKWRALHNPLVIRRHEWERIQLGSVGRGYGIRSRRIRRWVDDQNVQIEFRFLPLTLISVTPRHHTRFELAVLDFDSAHAAFYFKVTWL